MSRALFIENPLLIPNVSEAEAFEHDWSANWLGPERSFRRQDEAVVSSVSDIASASPGALSRFLDGFDAVVVQGHNASLSIHLLGEAKRRGIPVIFGVDDDFDGLDEVLSVSDIVVASCSYKSGDWNATLEHFRFRGVRWAVMPDGRNPDSPSSLQCFGDGLSGAVAMRARPEKRDIVGKISIGAVAKGVAGRELDRRIVGRAFDGVANIYALPIGRTGLLGCWAEYNVPIYSSTPGSASIWVPKGYVFEFRGMRGTERRTLELDDIDALPRRWKDVRQKERVVRYMASNVHRTAARLGGRVADMFSGATIPVVGSSRKDDYGWLWTDENTYYVDVYDLRVPDGFVQDIEKAYADGFEPMRTDLPWR